MRDHLPETTTGAISLRDLRQAAEARTGQQLGASVRELLGAYSSRLLRLELVRFTRSEGARMTELLALLEDLSDGPAGIGRAIWGALRGDTGSEPMPVRIEVWVDGEYERSLGLEVLDSRTYRLDGDTSPIPFDLSVVLRLYESGLDLVLQESDGPRPPGAGRMAVELTRQGAPEHTVQRIEGLAGSYELDCYLDAVEPGLPPTAEQLIDTFEARGGSGAWAHISRATVADELRDTIAAPELIRQGPTPLCGPSSVLYSLAMRAPRRYVRAATQLYEHGRFMMKSEPITADEDLRTAPVPATTRSSIRDLDWVLAASMRNSANKVFRIEGAAPWLAGITTASEVALWARELLGYEDLTAQEATITAPAGFDFGMFFGALSVGAAIVDRASGRSAEEVFRDAVITTRQGGEAYLMTTLAMFDGATMRGHPSGSTRDGDAEDIEWFWQMAPNAARHWVTIREEGPGHPLDLTRADRFVFDAFTWGAYFGVDASRSHFERQTFMVVCARVGHEP